MNEPELTEQLTRNALNLAHQWRLAGRWQDALTLLYGILPVANELNDVRRAQVWLHLARTLNDRATFGGQENVDAQRKALENALCYAEASGDASLLGAAWDSKGIAEHARFLNSDRAQEPAHELEFFERGLKYREQVGDARGLAESNFHLGLVYQVVRDDSKTGEPYFQRAYDLAKEANDAVMQSYAIRHLAYGHDVAGDYENARAGFQESLQLREQAGFLPGVAMAHVALGQFQAERGKHLQAREYLTTARTVLKELGATKRVEWIEQELSKLDGG